MRPGPVTADGCFAVREESFSTEKSDSQRPHRPARFAKLDPRPLVSGAQRGLWRTCADGGRRGGGIRRRSPGLKLRAITCWERRAKAGVI